MKITETGRYRVLKPFSTRGSISVSWLSRNAIIEITQIDRDGRKVIGPSFEDWTRDELPIERIEEQNEVKHE